MRQENRCNFNCCSRNGSCYRIEGRRRSRIEWHRNWRRCVTAGCQPASQPAELSIFGQATRHNYDDDDDKKKKKQNIIWCATKNQYSSFEAWRVVGFHFRFSVFPFAVLSVELTCDRLVCLTAIECEMSIQDVVCVMSACLMCARVFDGKLRICRRWQFPAMESRSCAIIWWQIVFKLKFLANFTRLLCGGVFDAQMWGLVTTDHWPLARLANNTSKWDHNYDTKHKSKMRKPKCKMQHQSCSDIRFHAAMKPFWCDALFIRRNCISDGFCISSSLFDIRF